MKKFTLKRFVLLLFICVFMDGIIVQAQTTSFIHYGVEQGMAQSQVQTILQDSEGNLWIGTLSGLTKYNGRTFTNYTKADGLAENWITASYKDKEGNLWFGHWAGGVTVYNVKSKSFQNLHLEKYTRFKTVTSFLEDNTGKFWIGTQGAGIFIYDPAANKMVSLKKSDGLNSNNINALCNDPKGIIWIGTDKGIIAYDTRLPIGEPTSFSAVDSTVYGEVDALSLMNKNQLWVGTKDQGVYVLEIPDQFSVKNKGKVHIGLITHIDEGNRLRSNHVKAIYEDHNHNIWIGTTGGGVTECIPANSPNLDQAIANAVFNTYSVKQGLNYFNVNTIYEDREKNVWIGTDLGLNQYMGERFQIYDESDSLVNNLVWSILADHKGNIWVGTNGGLSEISFHHSGANKLTHTVTNYTTRDGLSGNIILSIYEDKDQNLWFGTAYGGVCELKKGQKKFKVYSTANGLANNVIYAINGDNQGNIWLGTKQGASRLDVNTGKFRNYTTADGLGGDNIYRIFKDDRGRLWFGALGGYLSMYDGNSFKKFDASQGINHRFILTINEDQAHNIWFGAYGGGLYKYDGKTFTNYNTKDGLTTDSPYSIIADMSDNIWIGDSRGIDKYDPRSHKFIHYGKSEGFPGVEINPNATCMDRDGNIWFGTIMGAVRFDPKEDKPNTVAPKTYISGLKIFTKDTTFPAGAHFSYNQNHLTFKFIGISLTNPQKVLYQYKLKNFDKNWITDSTSVNEAVYSNIPPGKYTFMVKAANNDGVWNTHPAEYSFVIAPPFWQTTVFYILMTILVILLVLGFDRLRTRNLKHAKKVLEEKVQERTLELAMKNEELAEKNKDITDSIRYAKRIQEAILPVDNIVKKHFPESFILYKPKDIVSGDFYWLENKDNEVMIAAVDCTGHGVPGAFMSIIGYNLLQQAVHEGISMQPAHILDLLNQGVSETLKKRAQDHRINDGMDIALCTINFDKRELQFSGAYNPIYLVRNGELTEIKGDPIPIGIYADNPKLVYTNHAVSVQKGDTFYLFSDGFADQFGGMQGKKFKYKQMKELFMSIQAKSMTEQKEIINKVFEDWKGNMEQIDDVCVIGVRI